MGSDLVGELIMLGGKVNGKRVQYLGIIIENYKDIYTVYWIVTSEEWIFSSESFVYEDIKRMRKAYLQWKAEVCQAE